MIDKMKRSLCTTIVAAMALAVIVFPASADTGGQCFTDVQPDTWYYEAVNASAQAGGFVLGYGDGTFRPDAEVTRAELVKMLLAASQLTPNSQTAAYLHKASSYAQSDDALTDMEGQWLTVQGWTQIALDFGLILPADYPGGAFLPNQPATRCEAAVMIIRALGLVSPAQASMEEELAFTDGEAIAPSLRGYVFQAVEAGVLEGYPDGSFQSEKTISRAEAVVMIFRALDYMEEGIDLEIQVFAEEGWTVDGGQKQKIRVLLSAPAQVVDGVIYIPARDVYAAFLQLHNRADEENGWVCWDVECQQFFMNKYVYTLAAGAGDIRYRYTPYSHTLDEWSETFPAPARLLYGELMIPVCTLDKPFGTNIWNEAQWDGDVKILVIPLQEQYTPSS